MTPVDVGGGFFELVGVDPDAPLSFEETVVRRGRCGETRAPTDVGGAVT